MPTIDPDRAAFISQEFRYETATDATVKSNYPQSAPIEIDTNLGLSDAASLATSILNFSKTHGLVYEVTINGTLTPDDFATAPPHYTLDAPLYATDGRTLKLIGCSVDYENNQTTLLVRG